MNKKSKQKYATTSRLPSLLLLILTVLLGSVPVAAAPVPSYTGPATLELSATLRDFSKSNLTEGEYSGVLKHPDFEYVLGTEKDLVSTTLGSDGKPDLIKPSPTTVHDATTFESWFHDDPAYNRAKPFTLTLTNNGSGTYFFADSDFFPLDDELFGNQGNTHNYHFTMELHTTFTYEPGTSFKFTGDDDVWVYVNNQRVIDLGGVHVAQSETIDMDTLGLTEGHDYTLDLFFAERHTSESNFRMDTTLKLQKSFGLGFDKIVRNTRTEDRDATEDEFTFHLSSISDEKPETDMESRDDAPLLSTLMDEHSDDAPAYHQIRSTDEDGSVWFDGILPDHLYKLTEEDEADYEEGIGEDGRYIWVDKFGNITEYAKDGDEWYLVGSWEKETIINEFLPDPNIEVTKTYAPANPQTGDKVTYTITVKNTGNVPLDCGTGTLRNR